MNWYFKVLRQYFDFKGRARRKEYWMFVLNYLILWIIALILDNMMKSSEVPFVTSGPITMIFGLAMIIPSLAVSVRRLHDIGKSGVMMLLCLIPIIGSIWLLILFMKDGEEGENKYGLNPKEEEEPEAL